MIAPSVGDILYAGRASGWPAVHAAGCHVGPGESSWRRAIGGMSDSARLKFWHALGDDARRRQRLTELAGRTSTDSTNWGSLPTSTEVAIAARAFHVALSCGLRLSPADFTLRWCDYEPGTALGYCDMGDRRPIAIVIRRGQTELDTFRTICHELRHAEDALRGLSAKTRDRAELEQRAESFAAACVAAEFGAGAL